MTHQHPRCAQGLEVEERELMSIQELKIHMMQMTETQSVVVPVHGDSTPWARIPEETGTGFSV